MKCNPFVSTKKKMQRVLRATALKRSYHFFQCLLQKYICIFILECCLASVLFISSQQSHRPVQILFLGAEEILLLEFVSQFYLLKWGKLKDFRERRGAGLVYIDFLSPKKMNVEAQDQSDGLGRSPIFSVPFRTCSCDVFFLFPHVIMPLNNGKSVLLSRKGQQPKSVDSPPTYLHPPKFFWEVLTMNSV